MQKCSACEKPIYGHKNVGNNTLVCGSCALKPLQKGQGHSVGHIGMTLAKMKTLEVPHLEGQRMSKIKVRSNFARDRVIMISGGVTLSFDGEGVALVPAQFRENVENEMRARPGRFWFDMEVVPPVVQPTVAVPAEEAEDRVAKVDTVAVTQPLLEDDLPDGLSLEIDGDDDAIVESDTKSKKKASKKK